MKTSIRYVERHFNATIDFVSSIKMISVSMLSALTTFIVLSRLFLPSWTKLAIGAVAFLVIYMLAITLVEVVDKTAVKNLKEMVKIVGVKRLEKSLISKRKNHGRRRQKDDKTTRRRLFRSRHINSLTK
ncbi:MAG: hypothetical protein QXR45_10795 [Candidatus Bathyarchaeia archaeon]